MTITSLLEHFSASPHSLDVPPEFVTQFFNDRRLIVETTENHLRQRGLLLEGVEHALHVGGTDLYGQSTVEENFALHSIVSLLQPRHAVEIGLFRGQTALTINRASNAHPAHYTGIDIDADAIAIVDAVLRQAGLGNHSELLRGDSAALVSQLGPLDFAFIDGDHSWDGVVRDVVAVYNRLTPGGVLAMHDVGTPVWGWTVKAPGRLLHETLPRLLGDHAQIYWLDSMCRDLTMKLLSPLAPDGDKYFRDSVDSFEKARLTATDTVAGWGGLGFIHKLDDGLSLDSTNILRLRPAPIELERPGIPESRLRRFLNRCVQRIP